MYNNKYKVDKVTDETYQVQVERYLNDSILDEDTYWEPVYKGSLISCEAYIRLKTNPNIEF